jgi:asparagine synthase (glutamine-hydrolysing)
VCSIRHRGPDWSGTWTKDQTVFAHERLAIVDVENGAQPLVAADGSAALVVNGEIYNHKSLEAHLKGEHKFLTKSDCEVLLYLWQEEGAGFLNRVQGDFAFVASDGKDYLAARDPVGVCPMYWGKGADGALWFSSEMKALQADCATIEVFPPGHYYTPATGFVQYYNPLWYRKQPDGEADLIKLRQAFETAVVRRMMCDVPYGVLLSGGLDSSLVAAVATRYAPMRTEDDGQSPAWWPRLHSFCIGLSKDSPDQIAARQVAKFLGTAHHEFTFTVQDGIDAIENVIWHLETYDVTTVRASTPMYLLSRKIKALGVKMVLSGEGSDEIFGGYLYFHNAPDATAFHEENVRRVQNLHHADCLRANKSTAAFGLEIRVPFLDRDFMDASFSFDPKHKLITRERKEKWLLRKAFDTPEKPYLPSEVLWRQKEQFSDGVGYSWIDTLKAHCESRVSDDEFEARATRFPFQTPETKEAYYFRQVFEKQFPHPDSQKTVMAWVPIWSKSRDPSGRAQTAHEQTTEAANQN